MLAVDVLHWRRAILKINLQEHRRMGKQTHSLILDDDGATIEPLCNALGHAVAGRWRGTLAREKAGR